MVSIGDVVFSNLITCHTVKPLSVVNLDGGARGEVGGVEGST